MFKIPSEYRLSEKHVKSSPFKLQLEAALKLDPKEGFAGHFILPKIGTKATHTYVCEMKQIDGWNCIGVFVPSASGKPVTWDEIYHIKQFFWDPEDVIIQVMGKDLWVKERGWVLLWQPQDASKLYVPNFAEYLSPTKKEKKQTFVQKVKSKLWKQQKAK